eukprot:5011664-Lingulodinium_polyedra.AAC.1
MPHIGDMEPVHPLAVEPERHQGAVEIGWPGHLAMLLPDVTTPIPEGFTYVVTYYPTGAHSAVVERDDDNLTADEMKEHAAAVQAAK